MAATSGTSKKVVIVGAGLAGISAAIALKKQLGCNFIIIEKASSVGGTWRDTTYPGCGSDVPGHFYSLSTELNPDWATYYASQKEILEYWQMLHQKYELSEHTVFNQAVVAAKWEKDKYHLTLRDSVTGASSSMYADILIWAIGGFMAPIGIPESGTQIFSGEVFHSARWRHDIDFTGKRVAVIGNGCSAVQIVPQLAQNPDVTVVNICRTPQWLVPRSNFKYPSWLQSMFRQVPFVQRMYRNWIMATADIGYLIFRQDNTFIRTLFQKILTRYIRHTAPKEEASNIVPNYPPGCKRIIVDAGYLASLNKPNVSLLWGTVEGLTKNGVQLTDGRVIPLDIIIYATGYSFDPVDMNVTGSAGTTLRDYWNSRGGFEAYIGSCFPGFPNMFTLLGPNVATGHASVIFSEEVQIQHALQLIKPVLEGLATSFEVTQEASSKYNSWLQKRLSSSVWTQCNSYYSVTGAPGGKIIATFPGPLTLFWYIARRVKWDNFKVTGGDAWTEEQKAGQARFIAPLVIVALAVSFYSVLGFKAF